jgi:adenosylcobinamide kinase/adenosylcobinamide-phosphate guanylyltransferase
MALTLADDDRPKIFVATARPEDAEMSERIAKHRFDRSQEWITCEEPIDLAPLLLKHNTGCMVVDCLTLWISNLMELDCGEAEVLRRVNRVCMASRERKGTTIFVTNEVGMGIVPDNPVAREFRDLAGMVNQTMAAAADQVILMISGIPMELKVL